jgi:GMP synthase (glutamine-hydrolysing)
MLRQTIKICPKQSREEGTGFPLETPFQAEEFVNSQVREIGSRLGKEMAMIAISGGVDSTTCAAIMHRAIGSSFKPILIDTGFMRLKEPEKVRKMLLAPPLRLPLKIVRGKRSFMKALDGIENAEEKRKAFRETMYTILGESAKKERCKYLVQGTIAPDWIETKGGIKTQHNVLEQMGIKTLEKYGFTLIEPLASLYKDQVRQVARYLKVSTQISERPPFPGPGLVVRCVGRIDSRKLGVLKTATDIVERRLKDQGTQQYFAVILENQFENGELSTGIRELAAKSLSVKSDEIVVRVFLQRATGVKGDERVYGKVAGICVPETNRETLGNDVPKLIELEGQVTSSFPELVRVLYLVDNRVRQGRYSLVVRAVSTRDFMTADVTSVSWDVLSRIARDILKAIREISCVYYDVTPKPPATVEFE